MVLIPRLAQTSINNFLDHLGTDNLNVYYDGELKYGQFKGTTVNELTEDAFLDILQTLDHHSPTNHPWEIRKGNSFLLDNSQNHLQLSIGLSRLQRGVKEEEFSLGQALTGYWLIEDELAHSSSINQQISYYDTLTTSMALLSTIEVNNNLELNDTQHSLISETSNRKQNRRKPKISLIKSHKQSAQNSLPSEPHKDTQSFSDVSYNDLSSQVNSSLDGLEIPVSYYHSSLDSFQFNQSNFFQHQAFLHHLFSQLSQLQKLCYSDGKAIFTINGETLVAQLNEHNQWEYVSGTLTQYSLNQLQYDLNSSKSSLNSSPSQPFQSSEYTW